MAEFSWQNTTGAPLATQCAPVLHFGFSSRADAQIYGLCMPLSELVPIEGMDWQALARNRAEIEIPFRMSSAVITATPGTKLLGMQGVSSMSQVFVTASLSGHSTPKVRVRSAYPDQGVSAYSFTADGAAPVTISWAGEMSLENNEPGNWQQSRSLLFVESPPVPVLTPLSNNEGVHFDDYIVVFPTASELDPLYVMFRNRHEYPV